MPTWIQVPPNLNPGLGPLSTIHLKIKMINNIIGWKICLGWNTCAIAKTWSAQTFGGRPTHHPPARACNGKTGTFRILWKRKETTCKSHPGPRLLETSHLGWRRLWRLLLRGQSGGFRHLHRYHLHHNSQSSRSWWHDLIYQFSNKMASWRENPCLGLTCSCQKLVAPAELTCIIRALDPSSVKNKTPPTNFFSSLFVHASLTGLSLFMKSHFSCA